ncbi:winged helix-turn-helix domain-containing protein [Youngiibacter multivorans]|uniref:DNA-binding response OmpR family regulator n=1 Tax=Youngiibacter multivorans TaxID=937251 RepID=A0ABS4G666_9CLOT|nr:response regulator transcription factor [Youngiibacter multivorans]MBP1920021.1 DNA-binding response OmpR family regulator [Youngiibacter multivorans]
MHKVIIFGSLALTWDFDAIIEFFSCKTAFDMRELEDELLKSPDLLLIDAESFYENRELVTSLIKKTFRTKALVAFPEGSDILAENKDSDRISYVFLPPSCDELVKIMADLIEKDRKTCVYGDLVIDEKSSQASIAGEPLPLTQLEFNLLVYLERRGGDTVRRDELIRKVWGYSLLGDSRTIDTHVKSLRNKLGSHRDLIKTVWGFGYKFQQPKK